MASDDTYDPLGHMRDRMRGYSDLDEDEHSHHTWSKNLDKSNKDAASPKSEQQKGEQR